MKDSGNKMCPGVLEQWNIMMDLYITENGQKDKDTEQEWCYIKMEIYIQESGNITKDMGMASFF